MIFILLQLLVASPCYFIGNGGCRPYVGIIHSYKYDNNITIFKCLDICIADKICTGVEYFPSNMRCQFQNFSHASLKK